VTKLRVKAVGDLAAAHLAAPWPGYLTCPACRTGHDAPYRVVDEHTHLRLACESGTQGGAFPGRRQVWR